MSTCTLPSQFGFPITQTGVGVSKESIDIKALLEQATSGSLSLPASFSWRESLMTKVEEIFERCVEAGWDGYDAEPIAFDSRLATLKAIALLPDNIVPPDAVPEPAGEISLEWRSGNELLLSLTVTGRTLIYASIVGGHSRQHGEEQFFDRIPKTILEILARYFCRR
jgi:hypothetical protein